MSFINLSKLKSCSTLLLQEQKKRQTKLPQGLSPQRSNDMTWYDLYLSISPWWSCSSWLPRYILKISRFTIYCNLLSILKLFGHLSTKHSATCSQFWPHNFTSQTDLTRSYNNCSISKWATSMNICKKMVSSICKRDSRGISKYI